MADGIDAQFNGSTHIVDNVLDHFVGGFNSAATGISLVASEGWVDGNVIASLSGTDGYTAYYYIPGGDGGSAVGIRVAGVVTVTNNIVWSLEAANGGVAEGMYEHGGNGGSALSLDVLSGSEVRLWHNTFRLTSRGVGGAGDPAGLPGVAAGVRMADGASTSAANNILSSHYYGLLVEPGGILQHGHNNLWANLIDYEGASPGLGDRSVDPQFIDAGYPGDDAYLSRVGRLAPDSPLIDTGFRVAPTARDVDGQPRPMDGTGDGLSLPDIGADEFWPGTLQATFSVNRPDAAPGDPLTYTLVLLNPAPESLRSNVLLTNTLPAGLTFVPGSLQRDRRHCQREPGRHHLAGRHRPHDPARDHLCGRDRSGVDRATWSAERRRGTRWRRSAVHAAGPHGRQPAPDVPAAFVGRLRH